MFPFNFDQSNVGLDNNLHTLFPGFLLAADGRILKNISHDARGKKEEQFYKTVFSVEEYRDLRQFIPK